MLPVWVYLLSGDLSTEDFDAIKGYVVNPVESRLAELERPETCLLYTSRCV